MSALELDNDEPVISGDTYCSPRCGVGCKAAAYERASREAVELATRLGEGWTPVVWEYLGWRYRAERHDVAQVFPIMDRGSRFKAGEWVVGSYSCILSTSDGTDFTADAANPEDALGFAIQDARTAVSNINGMIEGLSV